jgi:hypothetical protein
LSGKVEDFTARMEVMPADVRVQDLAYRWGSCGKGDWLFFHWKTILLPARIAEYVVVHEMAHSREPHDTPEFWRRVERAMPDHEGRKAWLLSHGVEVEGLSSRCEPMCTRYICAEAGDSVGFEREIDVGPWGRIRWHFRRADGDP